MAARGRDCRCYVAAARLAETDGAALAALTEARQLDAHLPGDIDVQVADRLRVVGQLEGSGPYLPLLYLYLQDQLAVTVEQGTADFTFDYDLAWRSETGLKASVENLAFVLRDIAVKQAGASVVSLPEVRIDGGYFRYPEQAAGGDVLALRAPEVAVWRDPDGMLKVVEELKDYLMSSKITPILGNVGTPLLYEVSNAFGGIRTKNSQLNAWTDDYNASEVEKYVEKMVSCSSCFVHCRHRNTLDGEGPEYTALSLLGTNLGLEKLTDCIKLQNQVNQLGLDVSSTGTYMAWATELYERGMIDDKLTGGLKLEFGDYETYAQLIDMINERKGFGDILAEGQWAEVLIINGPQIPVDGSDITGEHAGVVLVYKNDTWASPAGWSGRSSARDSRISIARM